MPVHGVDRAVTPARSMQVGQVLAGFPATGPKHEGEARHEQWQRGRDGNLVIVLIEHHLEG